MILFRISDDIPNYTPEKDHNICYRIQRILNHHNLALYNCLHMTVLPFTFLPSKEHSDIWSYSCFTFLCPLHYNLNEHFLPLHFSLFRLTLNLTCSSIFNFSAISNAKSYLTLRIRTKHFLFIFVFNLQNKLLMFYVKNHIMQASSNPHHLSWWWTYTLFV